MPTYKNNTETLIVETIKNDNGLEVVFSLEPGKTLRTEFILTNANLTKLSDEPYWSILQEPTSVVTSTGEGDNQTVVVNSATKSISIVNNSSVLVSCYPVSTSNTKFFYCYPNSQRTFKVGSGCNQLVFVFPSEATIYVEQHRE